MKIDEAVKRACQEPTLVKALAWIALWDCERAIKQSHSGYRSPDGAGWETCFEYCFDRVVEAWREHRGAETFPYPENPGRTHYEGCYRDKGHHNCAVGQVDRLRGVIGGLAGVVQEHTSWRGPGVGGHSWSKALQGLLLLLLLPDVW